MPRPRIQNQLTIRDLNMHLPARARRDQHIMIPIHNQHLDAQLPEPIVRVIWVGYRPVDVRGGLSLRGLDVHEGEVVRLARDIPLRDS